MSLSTNTATAIQQIFIGLLGRPAKQGGLTYWTGEVDANNGFGLTELLSNIVNSQPEYINAVAGLSRAQIVTLHFNYLFNRNPSFDSEGHNYWVDGPGAAIPADQLVLALIEGASAQDMLVLDNKVSVANYITQNGAALTNDQARAILATVDTTLASIDDAKDAVDLALNPYDLSVADVSVVEGDAGTKLMTFTLNLDKVAATDVVIDYQTAAGTATAGSDYQNTAGTVTIAAGTKTASVSVTVNGDTAFEADETLQVNFTGIQIANAVAATGTIVNDDPEPQTFNLSVNSPSVSEGDNGTKVMNFTLTLDAVPNQPYTIDFQTTTSGTATAGVDFVAQSGQVGFGVGQTQAQVSITINGDTQYELNETVQVGFSGAALNNPVLATGTITNDDSNIINYTLTNPEQLVGTDLDDVFNGTQATAQLGDSVDGQGGFDVVNISLDGIFPTQVDLDLVNVEQVNVNARAFGPNFVDFSNTDSNSQLGLIQSFQSDFGTLWLTEIQNVNSTAIAITDTDEDHNIGYDVNAYAGNDTVDLTLKELRGEDDDSGTNLSFFTTGGPLGASAVDVLNIHSLDNVAGQVTLADSNYLESLNVGSSLRTITVNGNADLQVENTLDGGITLFDAGDLNADVDVDLVGQSLLTVIGGHSNSDGLAHLSNLGGGIGGDRIDIDGNGNANVSLQEGHDDLEIHGDGNQTVDGASGNDSIHIHGNGVGPLAGNDVNTGSGNDFLTIIGNGDQDIFTESGNDNVQITGNGYHDIDLASGNDYLSIVGNAVELTANPGPYRNTGNTDIWAGTGNDTVVTTGDGSYFADLGDGNDSFINTGSNDNMTIDGGANNDTITVQSGNHNIYGDGGDAPAGNDVITINGNGNQYIDSGDGNDSVLIDGNGVHRIENGDGIWLRGGNDTLHITGQSTNMSQDTDIDAGAGNDVVMIDLNHRLDVDLGDGADFIRLRARDVSTADRVAGQNADGLNDTVQLTNAGDDAFQGRVEESETIQFSGIEVWDLEDSNITLDLTDTLMAGADASGVEVNTQSATGLQTVDMTAVTVPLYSFFLNGGIHQDVLIARDASINSLSTLWFDDYSGAGAGDATGNSSVVSSDPNLDGIPTGDGIVNRLDDTLIIVNGADITDEDTENVRGLDEIRLTSENNGPQVWTIDIDANFINQATDNDNGHGVLSAEDLVITVDPTVAAGSTLYIELDPDLTAAHADLVINRTSNVTVYINGVVVTEPEMNTGGIVATSNFNNGVSNGVIVNTLLEFTMNSDNLVGGSGNNTFIAHQLSDIDSGDMANGMGGIDTLSAEFAVNNPFTTLQDIFENAAIVDIDALEFNQPGGVTPTVNNVSFNGIGLGYWGSLNRVRTGVGNDTIFNARSGVLWQMEAGNDAVTLTNFGGTYSVEGGNGNDIVNGGSGADYIHVGGVETVNGNGGNDTIDFRTLTGGNNGPTFVDGGTGLDWVYLDHNGTNGLLTSTNSGAVIGGDGSDVITASNGPGIDIWADGGAFSGNSTVGANDTITVTSADADVWGEQGDDVITATVTTNVEVDGGAGNDTITVNNSNNAGGETTVMGQAGNDVIVANSQDNVSVNGGVGNDSITVDADTNNGGAGDASVTGDAGNDTITVLSGTQNSVVTGDAGNDVITVTVDEDATVMGGADNDVIVVTTGDDASVTGDAGNDSITVNQGDDATVNGGLGNDTLNVNSDTLTSNATITGANGDDQINLSGSITGGEDVIVFGTVTYDFLQVKIGDTQGTDTITNFNMEFGGPGVEDKLDFTAFNGVTGVAITNDWRGGAGSGGAADDVDVTVAAGDFAVIQVDPGFVLNGSHFTLDITPAGFQGIEMTDNGVAVVLLATDIDGDLDIDQVDVYFITDVDQTVGGLVAAIDHVATIGLITDVAFASIDGANFV